jgi:hypothetical protein
MSNLLANLKVNRSFQEAWQAHRDDPVFIDRTHYPAAEVAAWTVVEITLSSAEAKEQWQLLADLGVFAVSFTKGNEWAITYAIPPGVSL